MHEIDVASLFEPPRAPVNDDYQTDSGELRAVACRKKAISYYGQVILDRVDGRFQAYCDTAFQHGLTILQFRTPDVPEMADVYALHPDQMWRVQALRSLEMRVSYNSWSDALEAFRSALLGYSEQEIKTWIEFQRWQRLGWIGRTIYLMIPLAMAEQLAKVANRCVSGGMLEGEITAFTYNGYNVIRRDANERLASHCQLGRVAIEAAFFNRLFGSSPGYGKPDAIVTAHLGDVLLRDFNSALCSPIQLLHAQGWSPQAHT